MGLIGLSGRMRVGKSEVAKYLKWRYNYEEMSFAAKLKEISMELFGLTEAEVSDSKTERSRRILQEIGCKLREIESEVWVKYLARKINRNGNFVISDVRFLNECEMIKNMGGKVIRIERPNNPCEMTHTDHISEIALDSYLKFDYILKNDGNLEMLCKKVDNIMIDIIRS
jgi:dephospho-CoA kinase